MIDPLPKERPSYETKPEKTVLSSPKKALDQTHLFEESASDNTLPQEAEDQTCPDHDTIADLFHDRDKNPVSEKNPKTTARRPQEQGDSEENTRETAGDITGEEDIKSPDAPRKDTVSKEETHVEIQSLKEELEKTQKRLIENQQYGRQNAQRLKNALKLTKEFVEEGSLSEEEAIKLMGSLETVDGDDSFAPSHPFGKVLATANKELENIRKYTDDDRLDDKVGAFDYFLLVASKEEQEQALEDLTDLMDNPLPLAKKMLSIGQRYEKTYREMKVAGGIQGLITQKDQDLENLRKSIDKLTKKLAQYEDFDKPRYRIDDHVGETSESEEDASLNDSITSLFSHRDAIRTMPSATKSSQR